jgi:hypothetical protein
LDRRVDFGPDSLEVRQRTLTRDTIIDRRPSLAHGLFHASLTRTTMRVNANPLFPEVLDRVERLGIYTPSTPAGPAPTQFPRVFTTIFCPQRHLFRAEPTPRDRLNGFAVEYVSFGPGRPDIEVSSSYGPQLPKTYLEIVRTERSDGGGYLVHLRVRCQLYNRQGQLVGELRDTEVVMPFATGFGLR